MFFCIVGDPNRKTPQLERNWGGGEKERERERNLKIERFSLVWRESDPVENVLNFYMWRESRISFKERISVKLSLSFSPFLSISPR
jgi:hypothetical protein